MAKGEMQMGDHTTRMGDHEDVPVYLIGISDEGREGTSGRGLPVCYFAEGTGHRHRAGDDAIGKVYNMSDETED